MSQKNEETIAQKIAAIIAKADSTTHEQEADVFMAKAHALLEQHGMSLLDLGRLGSDDPVGMELNAAKVSKAFAWQRRVADRLAVYYGCRSIFTRSGSAIYINVAGRESARITWKLMMPFVFRQVNKAARDAHNRGEYQTEVKAKVAIGNALVFRLVSISGIEKKKQEGGINALVPVDLIEAAINATFTNLSTARRSSLKTDTNARDIANGISLSRQTPAPSNAMKLA